MGNDGEKAQLDFMPLGLGKEPHPPSAKQGLTFLGALSTGAQMPYPWLLKLGPARIGLCASLCPVSPGPRDGLSPGSSSSSLKPEP